MKTNRWHCEVLRPRSMSEPKLFSLSGWSLYSPHSVSHSCTSQLYSDLTKGHHHLDRCTRSHPKAQNWSQLCLTHKSAPPPHSPDQWSHLSITYNQNFRIFIIPSLHTYIMSVIIFLTVVSRSSVPVWVHSPPLTSSLWSEPQVLWKMTFNAVLLSPPICSNLTVVICCPFHDPALKFWLFDYISLNGVLIRLPGFQLCMVYRERTCKEKTKIKEINK